MKFEKEQLKIKDGITKEWLITNGIGGYSSSTILGINTRKYHGLLVAPLLPPGRRYLVLSKLDESIEIENRKYNLYSNMCKNYISEGFKYLQSFTKNYIPKFEYKVENVEIEKNICMVHGRNTVVVQYIIKNGDKNSKLILAPIVNFRDFHCMSTEHDFYLRQKVNGNKVNVIIDDNIYNPIYLYTKDGKYIKHENDKFKNMYYVEEEKRGFFPEEDHMVPGRYEININAKETKDITFICSLDENIEEIEAGKVIEDEINRIDGLINSTGILEKVPEAKKSFIKDMIIATDNFVVYRPDFKLHTLIAGYHWFLDWGRDALISLEGITLLTKRYNYSKEIMKTFTRNMKFGLLPNGYSGFDGRPLYNSVDSSLLLFEQINKYLEYTKDYEFIKKEMYEVLEKIIENYKRGINIDDNNIFLDEDNLISSGTESTQNTWMDAKYGAIAITPRNGKAVEVNSLWYNALKTMQKLSLSIGLKAKAKKYGEMAAKTKESFNKEFYNKKRKCLYDVIGDSKIRPNQLMSFSLTYPVVDPDSEIANEIIEVVEKKLFTQHGLKTLAKGEVGYIDTYEGEAFRRDMSYHQGITWPWLFGIYNDCLENMIKSTKDSTKKKLLKEKHKEFVKNVTNTFEKSFYEEGCVRKHFRNI